MPGKERATASHQHGRHQRGRSALRYMAAVICHERLEAPDPVRPLEQELPPSLLFLERHFVLKMDSRKIKKVYLTPLQSLLFSLLISHISYKIFTKILRALKYS